MCPYSEKRSNNIPVYHYIFDAGFKVLDLVPRSLRCLTTSYVLRARGDFNTTSLSSATPDMCVPDTTCVPSMLHLSHSLK